MSDTSPPASRRILVVDDNAINRRLAMAFVKRLGFVTEEVEDGARLHQGGDGAAGKGEGHDDETGTRQPLTGGDGGIGQDAAGGQGRRQGRSHRLIGLQHRSLRDGLSRDAAGAHVGGGQHRARGQCAPGDDDHDGVGLVRGQRQEGGQHGEKGARCSERTTP